jgi:hypothetical protein
MKNKQNIFIVLLSILMLLFFIDIVAFHFDVNTFMFFLLICLTLNVFYMCFMHVPRDLEGVIGYCL